jgi:glutamyl-tRNA synthetase
MLSFAKRKIRTRFAPSPTGYLHVGGLRTALYAYLFAKQNQGRFILRIEDTDQAREVKGAVKNLLDSLKWAGLEPDEGIIAKWGKTAEKGRFGPYTQSKRVKIYQKYAQKLVDSGQAYYCFCSPQRLESLRHQQEQEKKPTRYDWHCRHLTEEEVKKKLKAKEPHVIRMKVPENQELEFTDWVRGKVVFNTNDIDDQVIIKSDGFPTYHLASVVDDHLMQITHVIRGEEWLSSTPKHILLYMSFVWPVPEFIHLPLLLNPDKSKLSKRQGDVSVEDYRQKGYLPEALVNFVALLGWNPGTEQEIFSLDELIKKFNLQKINKSGAVFDVKKLDWMNSEYIKKLSPEDFAKAARPFLEKKFPEFNFSANESAVKKILAIEQERVSRLDQTGESAGFFLSKKITYPPEILVWKKSSAETAKKNLELLVAELKNQPAGEWRTEKLEEKIKNIIAENNLGNGDVLWPMRVALTGQEKSPPPFAVAEILGKEKSLERLAEAIEILK